MEFNKHFRLPSIYYTSREAKPPEYSVGQREAFVREWALETTSQFNPVHKDLGMVMLQASSVSDNPNLRDIQAACQLTKPVAMGLGAKLSSEEDSGKQAAAFAGEPAESTGLACFAADYYQYITDYAETILAECNDKKSLDLDLILTLSQHGIDGYLHILTPEHFAIAALEKKGNWSKKTIFGALAKQDGLISENDLSESDVYAWRAEELKRGSIFVKPEIGACAAGIMKITLEDGYLRIGSLDPSVHSYLLAANNGALFEKAYASLESKETDYDPELYYNAAAITGLGSVQLVGPAFAHKNQHLLLSEFVDEKLTTTRFSPERLTTYDIVSDGYTMHVRGYASVREVLEDIASYYSFIDFEHYAERELKSALTFNGKPVEQRVIVQRNGDTLNLTGSYFKTTGDSEFSCISSVGFGLSVPQVFAQAQRNGLFNGMSQDDFDKKIFGRIPQYIATTYNTLNAQIRKHLPEFPFLPIEPTEVSYDFIYVFEGGEIIPKLVDTGFGFGVAGMGEDGNHILDRSMINQRRFRDTVVAYSKQ